MLYDETNCSLITPQKLYKYYSINDNLYKISIMAM